MLLTAILFILFILILAMPTTDEIDEIRRRLGDDDDE